MLFKPIVQKNKLLLFLVFFLYFQSAQSSSNNIITILSNETYKEAILNDVESELVFINGSFSKSKKYLVITSTNEIADNSTEKNKSPLLFIFKNKNSLSYDYTSLSQSSKFGNKFVLPYSYFDRKGFYLNITCRTMCQKNILRIETLDEIDLEIGEKFSYYLKDEESDTLKININLSNYDFNSTIDNVAFVVDGGEPKQLSMLVNKIKAKKAFGDVYYVNMDLEEIEAIKNEKEILSIEINVKKNVKFNFNSILIYNDESLNENDRNIYEGEYNQYLALKGNRRECFNVEILNEEIQTKKELSREILIIGKNNFHTNVYCNNTGESNKMEFVKQNEFDEYVISDGLTCKSSVKRICIESLDENVNIIQVHVQKRANQDNNDDIIRKMNEPLMNDITYKFILDEESLEDTTNKHINIHTHSQFYETNERNKDIVGLNVGIQVLYGRIKVYKDVCETFPYCSLSKEYLNNLTKNETVNSTFETINGEGGYYSTSILSANDTYSMNTKQNIIIIACKDTNFDGCAYQITYYNIESYKRLHSGSKVSKYLPSYNLNRLYPKKDNYELFLHKNKKIVLDLVVYSGDAYFTPITQKDGCVFEEHHLGSNERRIITCLNNNDEADEKNGYTRILFDIRANNHAAFYSVYALEKDIDEIEDAWPMEMTIMESIHETKRIVKILGKYFNDPPRKANSNYATIFNSLNCDLRVTNLNTSSEYSSEQSDDIIQDVSKANKRIDLFYEIKKKNDFHKENKNCLYFISSFDMNNEDSSFIIPEAKPFRFRLDWETEILRFNFPYAGNDDDTNKNVFLRVNLLNNIPIKLKTQIGFSPETEYILYYSKNIPIISNSKKLRKNTFTKIRISIETFDKDDEAIIDFSIRTNAPIPYSIKTEKYFSDLTLSNNIQYYMTLIKQNSEGEILVNFKRNKGKVYAKLIREDKLREVAGWGDRFIIPNNDIYQDLLLPYDPFRQKVFFTKNETNNCDKYCYLLFGVDGSDNINLNTKDNKDDYFVPYNLYLKYKDENETDRKFVDLQNNEYITNYLNLNKNDYYQYHIYNFFNNENMSKVVFDFDSENCELIIGFNTKNFSDDNHTKSFSDENTDSSRFEISKDEIIDYYFKDEDEEDYDEYREDLNLYFKIKKKSNLDKLMDITELDLLYTLRPNSPNNFSEDVNIINNIEPNNCIFDGEKDYYDYLMKLESINPELIIEIFALTNNPKNIYIYANVISSEEFGNYIKNSELPKWPNNYNHSYYHFPIDEDDADNYLLINYAQIKKILKDNFTDPLLLIRVYGEVGTIAKILTSMTNGNKNNETIVIPTINREQTHSIEENKTLYINLPNDDDYICKLIPLMGTGNITYHGRKYVLDGNYEPLVFNSVKGKDNTLKIESINYSPNKTEDDDFPFKFSFIFTKKKNADKNQINLGNNNFAYENIKLPMNYYVDISNVDNKDLSFDFFLEDFGYLYNDNEVKGPNNKLKNYTEDFNLKAYLLTEDELNDVIKNNKKLDDNKNVYQGSFDLVHHSGNIHIPKEETNKFKAKNKGKKMYLYTTVNKAYNNRNNYSFLKGKVNLLTPEKPMNKLPYNTYILGYIKGNATEAKNKKKVNHTYTLNLDSINEQNSYIKVEFTSTDKDIKFDMNSAYLNNSELYAKKYENMDKYGKNIYIIKPRGSTDVINITVQSPVKEYDNEYTFKYSLLNNYKDEMLLKEYPYEYNQTVTKCNISNTSDSFIRFKKIKTKNNPSKKLENCNCDYYISIYKKNPDSKKDSLNNTISIKKSDSPYATYKISNDSKGDDIEANIHVYTDDDFYYEIIAEDRDTKELFGYEKRYPGEYPSDHQPDEDKKPDGGDNKKDNSNAGNNESEFDWVLLVLIILGVILLIIAICLCCKFCCNSKKSKSKKKDVKIDLQPNETLYENELLEDKDKDNIN